MSVKPIVPESNKENTRIVNIGRDLNLWQGPQSLPSPEALAEFNKINSGFADIILDEWKKEAEHRRILEISESNSEKYGRKRTQNYTFWTMMGILLLTGYALYLDYTPFPNVFKKYMSF